MWPQLRSSSEREKPQYCCQCTGASGGYFAQAVWGKQRLKRLWLTDTSLDSSCLPIHRIILSYGNRSAQEQHQARGAESPFQRCLGAKAMAAGMSQPGPDMTRQSSLGSSGQTMAGSWGRVPSRSLQRHEVAHHGRNKLCHGRVNVHRALHHRVGCLRIHEIEDTVDDLITSQSQE